MLDFFASIPTVYWVVIIITLLALFFGGMLGYAAVKLKPDEDPIVEKIDRLLPQTQCGQCGYPGCKPYAEAIAQGDVITKCVPGGQQTVEQLADLLGVPVPETDFSDEEPLPEVAFINEDMCIGCTKCIMACPVDAIIGGAKELHTVIPDLCTGCELCVAPCPTDCIEMIQVKPHIQNWDWKFDNMIIPTVDPTKHKPTPGK